MSAEQDVETIHSGIASVLEQAVENGDLPGIVAAAATRDGRVFSGAYGDVDRGAGIAARPDSLFVIASMTKAVTTIATMQLVELGLIALDQPAADLLPRLATVQVLDGFDADDRPRLRAPRTTMTVRHLLAYTAGFAYPQWNADIKRYMAATGVPQVLSYDEHALDQPLVSDPGDRWQYGINSEFLGKIVEAVSGERLDRYFQRNIFDPLGMTSTTYVIPADQRHRLAKVHVRDGDAMTPIELALVDEPGFYPGGFGLFSTAEDYLRLTRMLLGGGVLEGRRLLGEQTVAELARNQMGGAKAVPMRSCDAFWTRDVDLLPGDDPQWGLGFQLNTRATPEGRAPFSLSWAGACNSFYWVDPARGVTGVFMAALVPFCDPRALAAFRAFEAAVYAAVGLSGGRIA